MGGSRLGSRDMSSEVFLCENCPREVRVMCVTTDNVNVAVLDPFWQIATLVLPCSVAAVGPIS